MIRKRRYAIVLNLYAQSVSMYHLFYPIGTSGEVLGTPEYRQKCLVLGGKLGARP